MSQHKQKQTCRAPDSWFFLAVGEMMPTHGLAQMARLFIPSMSFYMGFTPLTSDQQQEWAHNELGREWGLLLLQEEEHQARI